MRTERALMGLDMMHTDDDRGRTKRWLGKVGRQAVDEWTRGTCYRNAITTT